MVRTLTVALLLAVACSHGSSHGGPVRQQPAPPPGTGELTIAMDGDWLIVGLARLDGGAALPTSLPGAPPFLPVQVGQRFHVEGGKVRDEHGQPLYEPAMLDDGDFYANESDGRTLWFDVFDVEAEAETQLAVQAIFGSFGGNELLGFVTVAMVGSPLQGEFTVSSPNGLYRVEAMRLGSIVLPPLGGLLPPISGTILPPVGQGDVPGSSAR
jgi:hypothetical protein